MTTPKRCVAAALVLAGCAAKSGDVSPACVSRLI
jgi:hypothetical protein